MKIIESNEVTDRSSTELLDAKLGLNSAEYPMVNSEVRPLAKRVADKVTRKSLTPLLSSPLAVPPSASVCRHCVKRGVGCFWCLFRQE